MDVRSEKMKMMQYLEQYGASDINASLMFDPRGTKLKFLFTISE